jgi:benzoyl-CoA reductase/2-hydroxyglutaryl-CoA dehydratase subunit BcrC/BadD/HgdB
MSADYRPMWSNLGLDLQAHDALLGVLMKAYQDLFLSQPNRTPGMQYFDFVMSEVHGLRIQEILDAKARGSLVVGSYCTFVPEELILAIDGVSVGLCAGAEFAFDLAEQYVPRNTCSLIKSAFGFKLGKVCPYLESADLIVGENTCDGKKKSYEQLQNLVKRFYAMDLPQTKSAAGRMLMKAEYGRFVAELEKLSAKKITVAGLRQAIEIVNAKRQAVQRVMRLRAADPAPISGLDALLINQVFFYDDPVRFTNSVNKIADELEIRVAEKKAKSTPAPRLLVSGCPMAVPNWKVPALVEQSGAVIVGEESCVGERGCRALTGNQGDTVDALLDNLVDRYLQIDCAIFTPNPSRLDHIRDMVKTYRADGVIHYSLQFCQPYQMEALPVAEQLEKENIPVLRLETDYSMEDAGQLKTRIEAFLERIAQ